MEHILWFNFHTVTTIASRLNINENETIERLIQYISEKKIEKKKNESQQQSRNDKT